MWLWKKFDSFFPDSKGLPYPKFKVFLIILILLTHLIRDFESSKINFFDDRMTFFEDRFSPLIYQNCHHCYQFSSIFVSKFWSFCLFSMTFSVRDNGYSDEEILFFSSSKNVLTLKIFQLIYPTHFDRTETWTKKLH